MDIYNGLEGNNYRVTEVHISCIKSGDTIIHNDGKLTTVCKNNIKRDSFMGITLFGDSYKLGYQLVKRIEFIKSWEEKN